MAFDRNTWKRTFAVPTGPGWKCPACRKGVLKPVDGSFQAKETAASRREQKEEWWDPDMWSGRFVGMLECDGTGCKEPVVVAGYAFLEMVFDSPDSSYDYEQRFRPAFVSPAPRIFDPPVGTPKEVVENLDSAFGHFWTDPDAAGNRLRVAVERLLDALKVKARERTKKNKLRRLSLHERIEFLGKKHQDLIEHLLAIKWLGNVGSHETGLTQDDLLDAFEIISFALEELIGGRSARIKELAKKINKRKGRKKTKA